LHIAVDILIYVTTAEKTDKAGAKEMLALNFSNLLGIKKVIVDGGYSGDSFAEFAKIFYGVQVEVVKRNQLHKFAVLPKRWIVERSFG
jgi:transposase